MSLRLVTAPAVEPVTVTEAKARLRVDGTEQDDDLEAMLLAARQELDGANGWLGRAILTQTWDMGLARFPCGPVTLPLPPTQSIVSVKWWDAQGIEQTCDSANYRLVDRGDRPSLLEPVNGQPWPTTYGWPMGYGWPYGSRLDAITIRFVAGWATPEAVPALIKTWIMARAGSWLAQPEAVVVGVQVSPVPHFQHMLNSLRVW